MKIKIFFILWCILTIICAYTAKQYDRYNEHFVYKYELYRHFSLPPFLIAFANYDGAHYLHIAQYGYKEFDQAFFPFFPLAIRLLSPVFGENYFLTGFFLANISFALGFYIFQKYLRLFFKKEDAFWTLLFLLAFPTSFFFNAVYTEGLFFLFVIASLYFINTKKYWQAALFSFLAGMTRFIGVFLMVPLFIVLIAENYELVTKGGILKDKIRSIFSFIKERPFLVIVFLSPLFGLLSYMVYLFVLFHDPLAFYHVLYIFGAQRSIHVIFLPQVYYRYISIFIRSQHSFPYYVAILEFIIFNFVLFVLCFDFAVLWKSKKTAMIISLLGLNLFSFCNLILPTFSGSLSSIPRYALLSLSFFVRIGQVKNTITKMALLILFSVFHGLLLWLFIQGYFIG